MFSRFEFALKSVGYMKPQGKLKKSGMHAGVGPDWKEFATVTEMEFYQSIPKEVAMAIDCFKARPPMLQVGASDWVQDGATANRDSLAWLLFMVGRVRNNLFHGGKYPFAFVEPSRDAELLEHSLTILRHCLAVSKPVGAAFENFHIGT